MTNETSAQIRARIAKGILDDARMDEGHTDAVEEIRGDTDFLTRSFGFSLPTDMTSQEIDTSKEFIEVMLRSGLSLSEIEVELVFGLAGSRIVRASASSDGEHASIQSGVI